MPQTHRFHVRGPGLHEAIVTMVMVLLLLIAALVATSTPGGGP